MKSSHKGFTLEENIVLTNEELLSNYARFVSFIRSYEGITHEEARIKASALYKNGALDYINEVRKNVGNPDAPTPKAHPKSAPARKTESEKTIYEKNYDRLMAIAPDLEQMLLNYNNEEIYGKSVKTGYMDLIFELLTDDKSGFYISLAHYYEQNGDLVSDPDMEMLVNVNNKTVEALEYQDAFKYVSVYDDKYNRQMTNKSEKKSQNDYLFQWLKNLKNQGHKIKWREEDTTGIAPSFIVDSYKKEEQPKEKTIEKPVEKSEKVEAEKHEEPEQAKIISLNPAPSEEEKKAFTRAFIKIVTVTERIGVKESAMKALEIVDKSRGVPYLISAWEKMKDRDYSHLTSLNFFRLQNIVPNLLETLHNEGGTLRLVSDKTKTAFRITIGDTRKENSPVIGIYQLNGKSPEPTLLARIQKDTQSISTDFSSNGFAGLKDFNADNANAYEELVYESAIGFERWLKYLALKEFKPILVNLKKVEDTPAIETVEVKVEQDQEDEHESHYINKDIPDFEPGHVLLTETHKKYGVTQEIIDHINQTREGVTLYPRTKIMIHNTTDPISDKNIQAKRPGFRLSATGKFYTEGRSNRADRTDKGL
jgi:uncharacterized protein YqiB (DUF1249 family)